MASLWHKYPEIQIVWPFGTLEKREGLASARRKLALLNTFNTFFSRGVVACQTAHARVGLRTRARRAGLATDQVAVQRTIEVCMVAVSLSIRWPLSATSSPAFQSCLGVFCSPVSSVVTQHYARVRTDQQADD